MSFDLPSPVKRATIELIDGTTYIVEGEGVLEYSLELERETATFQAWGDARRHVHLTGMERATLTFKFQLNYYRGEQHQSNPNQPLREDQPQLEPPRKALPKE